MTRYIELDALVAWIESLKADAVQKKEQCKRKGLEKIMHQIGVYNKILSLINTLEVKEVDTEQLDKLLNWWKEVTSDYSAFKVKEVDLEKEVENLIEKEKAFVTDNREVKYYNGDSFNHIYELEFIAKHFYELGLKAQKGEEV
jgi:hypothetical protein